MRAALADVVSDLDALNGEAAYQRKFAASFADLGFDTFTYVSLDAEHFGDTPLKNTVADLICLTNLPPKWVAHYAEEGYADTDPVVKDSIVSRLPILWTESYRANSRLPSESRMMQDAWENGVRRGLTIPVHGPKGELGIFSLNSTLSDGEFLRATNETQFDAQVVAYHFHDAVQRNLKVTREIPPPIALTDREVEILRWTASGKTAWEIGAILKISERTVNFHLRNVMEKFGVHNKTHAATKALGLGLFSF